MNRKKKWLRDSHKFYIKSLDAGSLHEADTGNYRRDQHFRLKSCHWLR